LNAHTAIEFALQGGVIPAIVALAVFFAIGWLWPPDLARRYRPAVSVALATFIGYVLLRSTTSLLPAQFYEWIPYLGLLAAFLAGLTRADGVSRAERWSAVYVFAPIAAWLIVPQWPELSPIWPLQWASLAIAIIMLTALLNPLPQRLTGRAFPWWLVIPAAATSLIITLEYSETFGVRAAVPAGALVGCAVAGSVAREPVDWRGILLPYSTVVSGYAYTGFVHPMEPLWPVLLLPAAPLALWCCAIGPLSRLSGIRAVSAQAAALAVPLVIVWALLQTGSDAASDVW
jgi:hypothetical protein